MIGVPYIGASAIWPDALAGTIDQRPAGPTLRLGQHYYNTTTTCLEVWNGTLWQLANRPGWHDLIGDVNHAANVAALTHEAYRDTPLMMYWFHRAQDDALSLHWQMPHDWDLGAVEPHIHALAAGDATGNVRVVGRYAWSRNGTLPLPAWAGWTTFGTTTAITAAEQWSSKTISLGSFAPPAAAQYPSAMLHVWLQRPGSSDALDTYGGDKTGGTTLAANLGLESIDCHVRRTGLGTAGLYA
jgi:hypothetical protein